MQKPTSTQAALFIQELAMEILAEPDFAFRAALGHDATIAADLAAEISVKTLAAAKPKLLQSQAHILFEVVSVSSKHAIIDSIGSVYGNQAQNALMSDTQTVNLLPERSQVSLSAWRFPDESYVLCCRCADDSFAQSASALARSNIFLSAVGQEKAAIFLRADRGSWGAQGAYPLDAPSLISLLSSMTNSDGQWKKGIRISETQGHDTTFEHLKHLIMTQPNQRSSLDEALAAVFAEKNVKQ